MPGMCAAECVNKLVKFFIGGFVVYLVFMMYVYNLRVVEVRASKEPHPINSDNIKYILQFSGKNLAPFNFMGEGNSAFIKNKCKYTNCFVTGDKELLDKTEFDAIVFNGRHVINMKSSAVPVRRSLKQKYIFGATESADRFPVCNTMLDNFFNWTWTYKLDSDFRWGYITIYDTEGNKVGPAVNMKWPEKMEPISEELKAKLSHKSKAAAWFVSHCKTNSRREDFVVQVNKALAQYGHKVDIYGSCGKLSCPRKNSRSCDKKVQDEYFFYFSLENSFAEDYVTEKLLTALNNYAVPVVFGGADYSSLKGVDAGTCWNFEANNLVLRISNTGVAELGREKYPGCIWHGLQWSLNIRFLPKGSYLDGRKLGAVKLASVMAELMANKTQYYEFFRWRNHFTYDQTTGNADVCHVCDALNDDQMVNKVSVWKNFRKWWNGAGHKKHCP